VWLSSIALNVVFADALTARRALMSLGEAIPAVPGVPGVPDAWRMCLKPLVKLRTDRYAAAGTESTLYIRIATSNDTKELSPPAGGPRTHGTFSLHGAYSAIAARRRGGGSSGGGGGGGGGGGAGGGGDDARPTTAHGVASGLVRVAAHIADTLRHAVSALEGGTAAPAATLAGSKRRASGDRATGRAVRRRGEAGASLLGPGGGAGGGAGEDDDDEVDETYDPAAAAAAASAGRVVRMLPNPGAPPRDGAPILPSPALLSAPAAGRQRGKAARERRPGGARSGGGDYGLYVFGTAAAPAPAPLAEAAPMAVAPAAAALAAVPTAPAPEEQAALDALAAQDA